MLLSSINFERMAKMTTPPAMPVQQAASPSIQSGANSQPRDLGSPMAWDSSQYKTLIQGSKFDLIEDDNLISGFDFDLSAGKDFKVSSGNVLRSVPKGTKAVNMVNGKQLNTGVDLSAPIGTPIPAIGDGEVAKVGKGYNGGYGNFVLVKHVKDGKEVFSRYSHMGEDIALKVGQPIKKGDIIGKVSTSGNSSGPHNDRELFFKGEDGKTKFIFQDRKL